MLAFFTRLGLPADLEGSSAVPRWTGEKMGSRSGISSCGSSALPKTLRTGGKHLRGGCVLTVTGLALHDADDLFQFLTKYGMRQPELSRGTSGQIDQLPSSLPKWSFTPPPGTRADRSVAPSLPAPTPSSPEAGFPPPPREPQCVPDLLPRHPPPCRTRRQSWRDRPVTPSDRPSPR
jgi:hypothetical protein